MTAASDFLSYWRCCAFPPRLTSCGPTCATCTILLRIMRRSVISA